MSNVAIPLTAEHKTAIMRCRAELLSAPEAAKRIVENFALPDTPEMVTWMRNRIEYYWYHPRAAKWQAQVELIREEWRRGLMDSIRLANKVARVEELAKEYNKIPDESPIHNKDGDVVGHRRNTKTKLAVLEQIRVEVEGKGIAADASSGPKIAIQIVNAIGRISDESEVRVEAIEVDAG